VLTAEEAVPLPDWLSDDQRLWALVPLRHFDRLAGARLPRAPPIDRGLDWEDLDLLRVAGRQAASWLSEARGQEALADAHRFDEFNRRFAFILHDIKNLVSQLSLVARNAERHADNPEFRADMIATLNDSAAKMSELLTRLAPHDRGRTEGPRPLAAFAFASELATRHRERVVVSGDPELMLLADPTRLEQAYLHLLQNALDASPPDAAVTVSISRCGLDGAIEIVDRGAGMSAEFVRTQLFRPFASTKDGGFGIGAFEARSLVAAMGGRVEVESHEGVGSRFTIVLPRAHAEVAA
jgi:putative PEP-CTERM system histidine kinase